MEIQGKTVFPFIWKGGSPMLTAYKHDENHRLCPVAFEEMEKGSWINCAAPDAAELEKLNELTGIPVDSLQTALDREERSHVELEDDFIFVVVNTPVVLETDAYDALPLGIFITDKVFVTVCLENNTVIQKFINNNYASFQTYKRQDSFSRYCLPHRRPSCTSCSRFIKRRTASKRRCGNLCRTKNSSACWNCRNL